MSAKSTHSRSLDTGQRVICWFEVAFGISLTFTYPTFQTSRLFLLFHLVKPCPTTSFLVDKSGSLVARIPPEVLQEIFLFTFSRRRYAISPCRLSRDHGVFALFGEYDLALELSSSNTGTFKQALLSGQAELADNVARGPARYLSLCATYPGPDLYRKT
ncbi:hypothetical protein BJ912DRAFT_924616 [Pholiota molesta]|nr:hypothetical protein BJ912DRAFT_924616 [Pholiota molesta]